MKVLFITTTLPNRPTNGGEIATQSFIDGIEQCGHQVEVVGYLRRGDPPPQRANYHAACEWPIETELAPIRRWLWLARSILSGEPYICTKFMTSALRNTARRLCRKHDFDVVIIDHLQLAWIAEESFLPARKIGIAHNVEHRLLELQAQQAKPGSMKHGIFARDARLMKAIEGHLATTFQQIWVLTDEERATFRQLNPGLGERVKVMPLFGQDFVAETGLPQPDVDVVVLGFWLWGVNRRGLEWFMDEVVPLLPADMTIRIGGKGSEQVPNKTTNVIYEGFVPDTADFLRRGRAICIPSVIGAGIQLKTIEGIRIGRPLITTDVGLRGITEAPVHVTVVQDAAAMASAITSSVKAGARDHTGQANAWGVRRRQQFQSALANSFADLSCDGNAALRRGPIEAPRTAAPVKPMPKQTLATRALATLRSHTHW